MLLFFMLLIAVCIGIGLAVSDEKKKKIAVAATVVIGILYFLYFLKTASGEGIRVLPYQTWIMEGMKEYLYANEVL